MENPEIGGIPYGVLALVRCLPKNKISRAKYIRIMSMLLTFVTYSCFAAIRKPLPVVQTKIVKDCNVSTSQMNLEEFLNFCSGTEIERDIEPMMGYMLSFFLVIFGISTYVSGVIADCYNPRYFLSAGCVLTGFFAIGLGLCDQWKIYSYEYFTVMLVFFAFFQSMAWPILLACATHWYTGVHRGLLFGIWNINHYTGGMLGTIITSMYIDQAWGWSFFVPGIMIICIGFIVFLFLVIHPSDLTALERKKNSLTFSESEIEIPAWLDPQHGIKFEDALKIPGVIEFSACVFFSGMTSFYLTYQMPAQEYRTQLIAMKSKYAFYSLPYAAGAILGGVTVGILKDVFKDSAIICIVFLCLSIPVILVQTLMTKNVDKILDVSLQVLLGFFVEAPHILLSTSVSADLGTHSMIRRGLRGLSTVAGIVGGTSILGTSIAPLVSTYISRYKHPNSLVILTFAQGFAALCLLRLAIKDYQKEPTRMRLGDYQRSSNPGSRL